MGNYCNGVFAVDINDDEDVDIIAGNSENISVLHNNGNGIFQEIDDPLLTGYASMAVISADLNFDQNLG